jgi:hypothetical protein
MSKEQKATWAGVAMLVVVGLISNVHFKIPWFLTLVIACICGVTVGLIVKKLLGEMKEETKEFILNIIIFGIVILSIIVLIFMYLGIVDSPLLEEIIIGWLIPLTISLTDLRSRFELVWKDFKHRKEL